MNGLLKGPIGFSFLYKPDPLPINALSSPFQRSLSPHWDGGRMDEGRKQGKRFGPG
jgi:hypothetical protein